VPLQDLLDGGDELDATATRLLGSASATTQLLGRTHERPLCHNHAVESDSDRPLRQLLACRILLLAGFIALSGCASKVGWSPTERRVCAPKDPAQVCSRATPDYGHVIELGDTELLPGECAVLADAKRGGLIRVNVRDPRGQQRRRWIRAPRSKVTILELRERGEAKLSERRRCDRTPLELE
jgi:hypothetical protein